MLLRSPKLSNGEARDRACRRRPADDLSETDAARDRQGAPRDRRACEKIHRDVAVLRVGDLQLGRQRRRLAARRQSRFCPRRRAEPAFDARPLRQQPDRSEEHTSELLSLAYLVCRLLLEKKKKK